MKRHSVRHGLHPPAGSALAAKEDLHRSCCSFYLAKIEAHHRWIRGQLSGTMESGETTAYDQDVRCAIRLLCRKFRHDRPTLPTPLGDDSVPRVGLEFAQGHLLDELPEFPLFAHRTKALMEERRKSMWLAFAHYSLEPSCTGERLREFVRRE